MSQAPAIVGCMSCGISTAHPPRGFDGVKGEGVAFTVAVCSPECDKIVRRMAPRYSIQLRPALAGYLVSALGVVTGGAFVLSGRDLGRVLLVFGIFGSATTRLAYPDVVPLWLAQRYGHERASILLQWLGVLLAFGAVGLGAWWVVA